MNKQKILIFIDWFAPGYKAGGPTTSNVNIVEHLKDCFDFYVVTSDTDYHESKPYKGITSNKWIERDGFSVYYFSRENLSFKTLKKVVNDAGCDTWYINGVYSKYFSIYPLTIAKLLHTERVIVSARGMLSPHALAIKSAQKRGYLTIAKCLGLYKNVVFHATNEEEKGYVQAAISKSNEVAVAANLPRKMALQPDGCHKEEGEIRLVSFARISPEKNTLFALKALRGCKEKVVYHIYGQINSEAYWQECQNVIKHLPTNISVEYKGCIAPNDMPKIYRDYHALYLPSTGENYGHAILESFMNGCPVVISNKTPWLGLQEKNIGWDLPLDESVYAPVIDNLARMDGEGYKQMRKDVITFITDYLSNNETRNRYLKMFSL